MRLINGTRTTLLSGNVSCNKADDFSCRLRGGIEKQSELRSAIGLLSIVCGLLSIRARIHRAVFAPLAS
jgi:hypothetical protein